MKKTAIVLCAALMLSALPARAAETSITLNDVYMNYETGKISVSGTLGSKEKNKSVTLRLLNTDKTLDDAREEAHNFQKIDQTTSEDGGVFEFDPFGVNMDSDYFKSGSMTYYVECDGYRVEGSIYVADDEDVADAVESLNKALASGNITDIASVLTKEADNLSINTALFKAENSAALAKILYAAYKTDSSVTKDEAAVQNTMKPLTVLEAYNENKKDIVVSGSDMLYPEVLNLDKLDESKSVNTYGYFKDTMNDSAKKLTVERLFGRSFENMEDFYKTFAQEVVLIGISNPAKSGDYSHVRSLLTENAAYVGLNLTSYNALTAAQKNNVDRSLTTKSYANISELQKEINTLVANVKSSAGSTGVSSGGGGGSSSGGSTIGGITPDYTATNQYVKPEIFSDLADYDWAKSAIESLYDKNIVSGMGDGTFNPSGTTTREQFIKMFVAAAGVELETEGDSFTDVDETAWYAPYIITAKKLGITLGKEDGSFGIGESITRQDAMVMLKRGLEAVSVEIPTGDSKSFTDKGEISEYAIEAVDALSAAGVVNGDENGAFRPNDICSRAETAVILNNISALF